MGTLSEGDAVVTASPDGQVRPVGAWATQSVLVAIGAYIATASRELGIWAPEGPGPGFFPLVLALALVLLSVVWFVQTPRLQEPVSREDRTTWRTWGVTIASLVILAVVLDVVGFQIAMFAFLLFHLRWRGRVRWVTALVVAVVGSVGTFHLFGDLLLVPLPLATVPPLTLLGL